MHLRLQRFPAGEGPTFGWLDVGERGRLYTLEPNEPIPAGTYDWVRRLSPKRGIEVIELVGVPGHEAIQIHIGNTSEDTHGCILVGLDRSEAAIYGSRIAFEFLMFRLPAKGTIEIVPPEPA